MVVVRSCCCGCTLAQGTVGTGIVSMIESLLSISLGAYFLSLRGSFDNGIQDHKDLVDSYFYIVGTFAIVQGSLVLLGSVCLFCGVHSKRRPFLLPWLIIRGILLSLGILGCIFLLAGGQNFLVTILNILWMGLMIYLFLVVLSYYQSDMERMVITQGQILAPAPTTSFTPIPQQADVQYKPPYAMSSIPPAGTTVYNYPAQNPNASPAGQVFYPTQSYSYAPQQYAGGQSQPPPYPGNSYSEQSEKSGDVKHY